MSIKLTSAETGRNKSSIAAAVGTGNKISVAPFTDTYIKNTPNGWPSVSVGSIDTTDAYAIGAAVTIDNIYVTDSSWNILDDTALSSSGGYLKIIGSGFKAGAVVYIQGTPATSTILTSSTELRVTTPALTSGTLQVYVVNTDSSVAIKISGIVVSGVPNWSTTSPLPNQQLDTFFSIQLTAVSDSTVSYSLQSGSSLPSGVSLTTGGVLSGTVTGLLVDTNYNFTVVATDLELQDTAKVFSVTISFGDIYFKQSTLLINAQTLSNTWIMDASNTIGSLTVSGDTRPSAFSPYNSRWSGYFDGVNGPSTIPDSALSELAANDFCLEFWVYIISVPSTLNAIVGKRTGGAGFGPILVYYRSGTIVLYMSTNGSTWNLLSNKTVGNYTLNSWNHVAIYRIGGSIYGAINGETSVQTASVGSTALNNNAGAWAIGADNDNTVPGNFYISDLRLVVGSSVYTSSNFTPPTSKLTSVANTAFLTFQNSRYVDNGPNTFTVTKASGNGSLKPFGPYTETDLVTGSAYFDGTTDYIVVPDNSALELGSGDFCVECWIYPTSLSVTAVVIDKRSGTYGPFLLWRSTNLLQLYMSSTNSSWDLANGPTIGTLDTNQWYHVAVYRVGSTIYASFNGTVTIITASGGATPYNNAGNWYIGTQTDGSTNPWTGYIADMRFVIGSGVYASTNFTPPSSPLTNITNTKLLTLQNRIGENNQRFVDEGGTKALVTRFGNATQGTFTPYSPSNWSVYFDGTGDYLSIPASSAYAFGTNDFSIECWVYFQSIAANIAIAGDYKLATGRNWMLYVKNTGTTLAFSYGSSLEVAANYTFNIGTWYHLAVTRQSNTLRIFVNGNQINGTDTVTNSINNGNATIIGGNNDSASPTWLINGYISNLRIINGNAVYTANTTPSTSPLSVTSNTKLLICKDNNFTDESTNNVTITVSGESKVVPFSPFIPSSYYTASSNGASIYLDGTGDYVTIASDTLTTLSSQDFTIEFWTYITSHTTQSYFMDQRTVSATLAPWITANSTTTVFGNQTVNRITGSGLIANSWNHVAVSRLSGSTKLFINGTQSGSTYTDTNNYVAGTIYVGSSFTPGQQLIGYISDFNITREAKYTANFTVPVTATAITGNTITRLEFDNAGIIDYTCRNAIETVGVVKANSSITHFGSPTIGFPGSLASYLATPTKPELDFGTGDFTVEFWVYFNSVAADQGFLGGSTTNAWEIRWRTSTGLNLGRLNIAFDSTFAWSPSVGIWYHVAVTRSGTSVRAFINGSQIGTTLTNSNTYNAGPLFFVGLTDLTNNPLNGYLDDIRITKGYARYTANTVAPTGRFPTK